MKVNGSQSKLLKVKVINISKTDKLMTCYHASGATIQLPYSPVGNEIEIGQIIAIAYRTKGYVHGYVIADTLMQTIEARVLDVQRIIENGKVYIFLVFENIANHSRMSSIVQNGSKLFPDASTLIPDDIARVRVNNNNLYEVIEVQKASKK